MMPADEVRPEILDDIFNLPENLRNPLKVAYYTN